MILLSGGMILLASEITISPHPGTPLEASHHTAILINTPHFAILYFTFDALCYLEIIVFCTAFPAR